VSKVFALLRAKLNGKEKELLELQRAEPCLMAPDSEQINSLVDAISSLHLSTQDGSFIFASAMNPSCVDVPRSSTSPCPTGIDSIKTLPSTVWLSDRKPITTDNPPYRLPMVTELLSFPLSAYVSSPSGRSCQMQATPSPSTAEVKLEPSNRLPLVSELLSMPIDTFRSSAKNRPSDGWPLNPANGNNDA
jgi:hypothetical protein